jgi:hypothetical protein
VDATAIFDYDRPSIGDVTEVQPVALLQAAEGERPTAPAG